MQLASAGAAEIEDYRAAASIDLVHDDEAPDARVACVVELESVGLQCGHFIPEEEPERTVVELERFFS